MDRIADIGIQGLDDLAHQRLGAQLQHLVRHVHPVDKVAVVVEPCRTLRIAGVLDDDGGSTLVHHGNGGIVVIGIAQAQRHADDEPVPAA